MNNTGVVRGMRHLCLSCCTRTHVVCLSFCEKEQVHVVAGLGCRDTVAKMEAFLHDNKGIRFVWTPDAQTRVNVSRYNSAAVSQMVINLRPARWLQPSPAGSDQEIQALQRQAQELQRVGAGP